MAQRKRTTQLTMPRQTCTSPQGLLNTNSSLHFSSKSCMRPAIMLGRLCVALKRSGICFTTDHLSCVCNHCIAKPSQTPRTSPCNAHPLARLLSWRAAWLHIDVGQASSCFRDSGFPMCRMLAIARVYIRNSMEYLPAFRCNRMVLWTCLSNGLESLVHTFPKCKEIHFDYRCRDGGDQKDRDHVASVFSLVAALSSAPSTRRSLSALSCRLSFILNPPPPPARLDRSL